MIKHKIFLRVQAYIIHWRTIRSIGLYLKFSIGIA